MADDMGAVSASEMVDAFSAVKDQVVGAVRDARERFELDRRMQENPWAVLGIAAGAGFVLGGGLWPTLRPIVKVLGRTVITPANVLAVAAAIGAMRAAQASPDGAADAPVGAPH